LFDGGTGNNQIYDSGTGNDTLIGGVGSGNDTLVVSDFPHTATLDASGETGSSSLYAAGSGNDTLIGGIGNDTLTTADFAGTSSLSGGPGTTACRPWVVAPLRYTAGLATISSLGVAAAAACLMAEQATIRSMMGRPAGQTTR
jgi:hypothetical protein